MQYEQIPQMQIGQTQFTQPTGYVPQMHQFIPQQMVNHAVPPQVTQTATMLMQQCQTAYPPLPSQNAAWQMVEYKK